MKKPASKHTWRILAEFSLEASPPAMHAQGNPVEDAIQEKRDGRPIRDNRFEYAIQAIGAALPMLPRKSLARLQTTLAKRFQRATGLADGAEPPAPFQIWFLVDENADRLTPGWGFFIVEKGQPELPVRGRIEVFFYAEGSHGRDRGV